MQYLIVLSYKITIFNDKYIIINLVNSLIIKKIYLLKE